MRERIAAFLRDLDASLAPFAAGEKVDIFHIGRSALVWQFDFSVTTQDFDVLVPGGGAGRLMQKALELFGRGTLKASEHGFYLEIVNEALPPMPTGYERRATEAVGSWRILKVYHLDPHDLAASKLKRFAAKDREDIRQLCDLDLLDDDRLESLLENAFQWHLEKDGNPVRDGAFQNLRIVQRYLQGHINEF